MPCGGMPMPPMPVLLDAKRRARLAVRRFADMWHTKIKLFSKGSIADLFAIFVTDFNNFALFVSTLIDEVSIFIPFRVPIMKKGSIV